MNVILAALINGAIAGALLTAAVSLALRLAPRRLLNAASRYAIWYATLLVIAALPLAYFERPQPAPPVITIEDPASIDFPETGGVFIPEPAVLDVPRAERIQPHWSVPSFPIEIEAEGWPAWVLGAWLSASALMLLRLAASYVVLERRKTSAVEPPLSYGDCAARWVTLCGSRRKVRVSISRDIAAPVALGPHRPTILFPARLLDYLDEEAFEQVGLHEAAHLARYDDYALLIQRLVEAGFAVHPIIRWIAGRIDVEREIACDDFVVAITGQAHAYATSLTCIAGLTDGARSLGATAAADDSSHLATRIELLLDRTRHSGTRLLKRRVALAAAVLAALTWAATKSPSVLAFAGNIALPAVAAPPTPAPQPVLIAQATPSQPAASLPQAASTNPDEPASASGKVIDAKTHEPVRKVTITFSATQSRAGSTDPGIYTTATDNSGEFKASGIPPGPYRVSTYRPGYLSASYGTNRPFINGVGVIAGTLTLNPGQKITNLNFELTPHSVITGRVVDAAGNPVADSLVAAMRYAYVNGVKQLNSSKAERTDDRGMFRLADLAGGTYFVGANLGPPSDRESSVDRSATVPKEIYVPTYYPGTPEGAAAAPIQLAAATTVEGIEIKLVRAAVTTVRGRVVNQTGANGPIEVHLEPAGRMNSLTMPLTYAGPQGNFEIRGVRPGRYLFEARLSVTPRDTFKAFATVDVGDKPIENLLVTITAGIEIPGAIRVVDGDLSVRGINLTMHPPGYVTTMADAPFPSGTTDGDGHFHFTGVSPRRYALQFNRLPQGYYVKSAMMGGRDVYATDDLDLSNGAAGDLDIVLSGRAGSVAGVVRNKSGTSVAGAMVALVPSGANRRGRFQLYRSGATDQAGRFNFASLSPGEYRLFSWEVVDRGAWTAAEFLQPIESKGKAVTIREAQAENVELTVLPSPE